MRVFSDTLRRLPLNLPNALTVARIFLVPLLVVVLLTKFEGRLILGVRKELVGAAIFALASLTDWLDGYLARRRHQVTTLGQLMDPLADKLLITAALVSLVQMDLAPAWMVAVILGRELAVTVLRSLAYTRGVTIPASNLGKIKMVSQVVAILLLILGRDHVAGLVDVGHVALWVAVGTAVVSGTDYYRRYNQVLNPRTGDADEGEAGAQGSVLQAGSVAPQVTSRRGQMDHAPQPNPGPGSTA